MFLTRFVNLTVGQLLKTFLQEEGEIIICMRRTLLNGASSYREA